MAFVLIAPSLAVGCEQVFGLAAMWVTPSPSPPTHSGRGGSSEADVCWPMKVPTGHMPTHGWMTPWPTCLCPVRGTLVLWLKAYLVWMPAATWTNYRCGGYCSAWRPGLFALRGWMGASKLCCLNLKELPLWNVANADEPAWDLPMIDVDLSGVEPWSSILHQSRRSTQPESQGDHWSSYNGRHPQLAPDSPLQYITSRTQPPSAALGPPFQVGETENSLRSVGTDPIIPALAVTLPQTSSWVTPPGSSPGSAHSTEQLFQLTGPRTLEAGRTPYIKQPLQPPQKGNQPVCLRNCFSYRKKWTLL